MNEIARQVLRWAKIALGFALLVVGIIGGFIPVLQGWMFVLPGLAILATEFRWAKKLNRFIKLKFKNAIAKAKAKRAEGRRQSASEVSDHAKDTHSQPKKDSSAL